MYNRPGSEADCRAEVGDQPVIQAPQEPLVGTGVAELVTVGFGIGAAVKKGGELIKRARDKH